LLLSFHSHTIRLCILLVAALSMFAAPRPAAAEGDIPAWLSAYVGEGDGQIERVMADVVQRGYDGFATLEPHLLGGGPTGGVTGPELFPKAVQAFRDILRKVGATVAD